MFFDTAQWPFVAELESEWQVIRDEFLRLEANRLMPWPEKHLYQNSKGQEGGWSVMPLYAFGKKLHDNCRLFAQTTAAIEKVPMLASSTFSVVTAGTHIAPHKGYVGYSEGVLRCHLGLICTPGSRIRVEKEVRSWEDGKLLVFDDMMEHEVWNDSDQRRLVLIVDILIPDKAKLIKQNYLSASPELAAVLEELRPQIRE
jgi:ornithine lipid ester-linked acyl 2-hydroxylase